MNVIFQLGPEGWNIYYFWNLLSKVKSPREKFQPQFLKLSSELLLSTNPYYGEWHTKQCVKSLFIFADSEFSEIESLTFYCFYVKILRFANWRQKTPLKNWKHSRHVFSWLFRPPPPHNLWYFSWRKCGSVELTSYSRSGRVVEIKHYYLEKVRLELSLFSRGITWVTGEVNFQSRGRRFYLCGFKRFRITFLGFLRKLDKNDKCTTAVSKNYTTIFWLD